MSLLWKFNIGMTHVLGLGGYLVSSFVTALLGEWVSWIHTLEYP